MKFKVGDKVVRTEVCADGYTVKQGNTYTVKKIHKELGVIYLEDIFDSNGNLDWFNPDNFELVKENTPKFKKGDKVKCVKSNLAKGVDVGGVYTIKNPQYSSFDYNNTYHVTLEEAPSSPHENVFELYEQEDKNYRHLSPGTLIPISIDGVESEVPLGDLVHATALIRESNGEYGYLLYKTLKNQFNSDSIVFESNTYPDNDVYEAQQKLLAKYFIDPKKEQQKEDIKKTILAKETELKQLQNQLKELD